MQWAYGCPLGMQLKGLQGAALSLHTGFLYAACVQLARMQAGGWGVHFSCIQDFCMQRGPPVYTKQ